MQVTDNCACLACTVLQMKMLMGFIVKARGMVSSVAVHQAFRIISISPSASLLVSRTPVNAPRMLQYGVFRQALTSVCAVLCLQVQVHPHELLVPTSSDCEVNLWLLTLAATLATRPAVADTSAPDATALDNTPMALARMMGPPQREVTPQPEEHRSLYGDEAMEAYMSGLEWTRDLWERARVVPGRTPLYDPGNSDPLFLEFHADTQRGWDQPQRHAQRQYRHEWECAERAARAQIAARRAAESQVAATTPRSASGDLACKDQGTVSSDSQPQVEQGSVAVGLDTADTQQQQQQATSSTSEDPSHAARCKQPGPCPQPKADAQPTKPAKKDSLASRFLGSTKRKACRLADKTGRFVTAAVDGIVDFVTAI